MQIGEKSSPYEAIVSVLMLREGWDVPEVAVIALLRRFSSRVYGQQVIGRGLRKVIREPGEREILCVVDHPKLDHDWLWDLIGAKVKAGVKDTDTFDTDEDLPEPQPPQEPELVHPDKVIEVPEGEEGPEGEVDFNDLLAEVGDEEEPRKDWADALAAMTYPHDAVEITKVTVKGVKSISLDPTGFVKFKPADEVEDAEAPSEADLPPAAELSERLKQGALGLAEELLFEKGFSGVHKDLLYDVVMDHLDEKLLDGQGLAGSSQFRLLYAVEKLPEVREAFMEPGIVSGIVKFPRVASAP
jgi:type III restriction enzyme